MILLSNALLSGLAPLRERLKIPVVGLLQDEDGFLDGLAIHGPSVRGQIEVNSEYIDHFVSVSRYFRESWPSGWGCDGTNLRGLYADTADFVPADAADADDWVWRGCATITAGYYGQRLVYAAADERFRKARLLVTGDILTTINFFSKR